jgi:NAD(P)-dependent dehydrogenase (short-subunit alcohol dehydrogenase family)
MTQPHWRTALVTGASSGIGRELARRLAAGGTEVVVAARRRADLDALAAEIAAAGGRARAWVMDCGRLDETVAAVRRIDAEIGGLDLVVANAGVSADRGADRFRWEAMASSMVVNFPGAVATLTAVLPEMIARRRGHLVAVASIAAYGPLPRSAGYCAPKAGLAMFMECLRLDLAGTGVHATCVYPGFVRTPMTAGARHPLPLLMDCPAAVDRILARLPRAPAAIAFPRRLAWFARAAARVPRPVRGVRQPHQHADRG